MRGERVWLLPRIDGEPDAHGGSVPSFPAGPDDPGAVAIDRAAVAPETGMAGEAAIAGREAVVENLRVYLPPGTRVPATARMVVRDTTYDVIGEGGVFVSPMDGREWGVVVALKRTEG